MDLNKSVQYHTNQYFDDVDGEIDDLDEAVDDVVESVQEEHPKVLEAEIEDLVRAAFEKLME